MTMITEDLVRRLGSLREAGISVKEVSLAPQMYDALKMELVALDVRRLAVDAGLLGPREIVLATGGGSVLVKRDKEFCRSCRQEVKFDGP